MTARHRLPNRRASQQIAFECNGLRYVGTVSFFPDGKLAEIFLGNAKAGSHSDSAARTLPSSALTRTATPAGRSASHSTESTMMGALHERR
jgi:hypothetical protein